MSQGMKLEANTIVVARKNKVILNDISFTAEPGKLTAIIGPNGAGKTTLMRALSGERPDKGSVRINGEDIYADPEYWLQQIGYVPVDNILHEQLSLSKALFYIGKLRLPGKTDSDIRARVDELLTKFKFAPGDSRREKPLSVLSSGERKKANVCSELMIDPPILLLDEPTSNLDPDAEYELMNMLADIAHTEHKTIVIITHTLNTLSACDVVVFVANGDIAAPDKPMRVLEQLEQSWVPHGILAENDYIFTRWAAVFAKNQTDPSGRKDYEQQKSAGKQVASRKWRNDANTLTWSQQLQHLLSRYLQIRFGERANFLMTLLAGFSGLLFFILPANTFIKPFEPSEVSLGLNQARQSVYVVSLVITVIGLITTYTEISKEFRIYRHERLKGLSPVAYVLSKWLWLALIIGVLASVLILSWIVLIYGQPLPGFPQPRIGETLTWWERLVKIQLTGMLTSSSTWIVLGTLILACITSVTVGLLVSALAADTGRGYLILSFVIVFIILFSGLIRNAQLEDLINRLAIASTGKWAYEGLASSIGVYCWTDSWRFDEFASIGHLLSVWMSLIAFILIAGLLTTFALWIRDPWSRPWNNVVNVFRRGGSMLVVYLSLILLLVSYTTFLRNASYGYHELNYWSRKEFGGTNAYVYAQIDDAPSPNRFQRWIGNLSQAQCNEE